jgi:hypothetical protein
MAEEEIVEEVAGTAAREVEVETFTDDTADTPLLLLLLLTLLVSL